MVFLPPPHPRDSLGVHSPRSAAAPQSSADWSTYKAALAPHKRVPFRPPPVQERWKLPPDQAVVSPRHLLKPASQQAARRAPNRLTSVSDSRADALELVEKIANNGGSHTCAPHVVRSLRTIQRAHWTPDAHSQLLSLGASDLFPQRRLVESSAIELERLIAPQCSQHAEVLRFLHEQYQGAVATGEELLRVLQVTLEQNALLRAMADERMLKGFHDKLGKTLGELLQPEAAAGAAERARATPADIGTVDPRRK